MFNTLVIGASSFTGAAFCRFLDKKGLTAIPVSLREPQEIVRLVESSHPNLVVNFAALNVVKPSWDFPHDYLRVNVDSLTWLAEYLRTKNLIRFVQISTPEVYGNTGNFMVKETDPFNPSTPYAVSRAAGEMMLKCFWKNYGFPVVFTRACNVYGPGQQLHRLIPKLIVSIKKGQKFPLEGGGNSKRAFVHIDDCCDAIWRVCLNGELGSAYHIAPPMTVSIVGLVDMICRRLGTTVEDATEVAPERPGKDRAYELDSSRIRQLGWQNRVWIEDGIEEVIDWVNAEWETLKDLPMEYVHQP